MSLSMCLCIIIVIIAVVLFVLQHRTVHVMKHKASSHKHHITHRFSTVIYMLPNNGTRFTQCRKLTILTKTTNRLIHNIRGNSKTIHIYTHAFTF